MSKYQELMQVLQEVKKSDNPLYVIGHKGFCPDWYASGLCLMRFSERIGLEAMIAGNSIENIGYPANTDLASYIGTGLAKLEEVPDNGKIILVDCHSCGSNVPKTKGEVIGIIDHHELKEDGAKEAIGKLRFSDVRPGKGSTSAILTEYLKESLNGDRLDPKKENDKKLATALMFGIRIDTQFLSKDNLQNEYMALEFLENVADKDRIRNFESNKYPYEALTLLSKGEKIKIGNYLINIIPAVNNEDFLPPVADVLTDFKGYDVIIVVGEVVGNERKERRFVVKARSCSKAYNILTILENMFGKAPGGVDSTAGGMELSLSEMFDYCNVDLGSQTPVLSQILSNLESKLKTMAEESPRK